VPLCEDYLPGFSLIQVGFSIPYSSQFLAIENAAFIMLQETLVTPWGRKFIRDVKAAERRILSWTVNDEEDVDWATRKGLDGIVTDDPRKCLELQDQFVEGRPASYYWSAARLSNFVRTNMTILIFEFIFRRKYGFGLDRRFAYKNL
jgi:hypothetical protein